MHTAPLPRSRHRRRTLASLALGSLALATLLGASACAKNEADAKNASGGAGGKKGRSVVLAPTDVAPATTGSISDGIAITGTLRPLDQVDVRARIEGDLTGVFVREGQHVDAGQLLAQFEAVTEQTSATSARAATAAAQADLKQAQWNLQQTTDLYKAGAVSEADYRASQQAAEAARARLAAASAQESAAAISARDTRVVAPMSGVIDKRLVDPGEHLARGADMFTLVRNNTLELAATVPERRAPDVRIGERVAFTAEGRAFDGHVTRISPTVDPASRSITVYVDVDNASGALKGNTLATGSVVIRTVDDALIVPTTALHQSADSGATYVYRVNTGAVEQVPVTVGIVDNRAGTAQITSGLNAGDRVVVGNVGTLAPGAKVQIVGGDRGMKRR
jgi:RND family efflux transporter MFP subunit